VRTPHVTMVESAVRLMLGYGYGFDTQLMRHGEEGYIPDDTLAFAQHEYQYMRFGLALTLMHDGYYTHEIGDSWHGQDWRYDEEGFNLGLPSTNATRVNVSGVPPPAPPTNMGTYKLWVNTGAGASASKRAVTENRAWVIFLNALAYLYVRPMGRTHRQANEIELAATRCSLNGSS